MGYTLGVKLGLHPWQVLMGDHVDVPAEEGERSADRLGGYAVGASENDLTTLRAVQFHKLGDVGEGVILCPSVVNTARPD